MKRYSSDIEKVYTVLAGEFKKHRMPVVDLIEMQTRDPFKVLVATILSARTKDQTTTTAARHLFERVSTPQDLASLPVRTIEELIYPVGFYHDKARHLAALPGTLTELFNGVIPDSVEELIRLPGVGRKTANLVVAVAFGKPAVCVDIHVHRIFNRLGFLATKSPLQTEMTLRKHLPVRFWTTFNSYFVSFGQHRCTPIHPHCSTCPIASWCARKGVSAPR